MNVCNIQFQKTFISLIHLFDHGDGALNKRPDEYVIVDVVRVPNHHEENVSWQSWQHLQSHLGFQI